MTKMDKEGFFDCVRRKIFQNPPITETGQSQMILWMIICEYWYNFEFTVRFLKLRGPSHTWNFRRLQWNFLPISKSNWTNSSGPDELSSTLLENAASLISDFWHFYLIGVLRHDISQIFQEVLVKGLESFWETFGVLNWGHGF